MIQLDANFLIDGVDRGTPAALGIVGWLRQGEELACSSIAWAEFLNGPVMPDHEHIARDWLIGGIVPFDEKQAALAARLYNGAGRRRSLKFDSLIAAAAVTSGARLATNNKADFQPFVTLGLQLA